MFYKSIKIYLFLIFCSISNLLSQTIDNFEDGTTQGWQMGGSPKAVNIPTGGPTGEGDGYLQLEPDGSATEGKLVVLNQTQWTGDFVAKQIIAIVFDVNNFKASDSIDLRIALKNTDAVTNDINNWVATINSVHLQPSAGWHEVIIPIQESDLVALGTSQVSDILLDVGQMRILDATADPAHRGDETIDTLGLDNIRFLSPPPPPEFSELDIDLPALENGEMAVGDYDNDGDLDIALVGFENSNPVARIYRNDAGVFNMAFNLAGSALANVDWGDIDNDGDLDLLMGSFLYINQNNGNAFDQDKEFSPSSSDLTFIDFDNDGDLDVFWAQTGNMFVNDDGVLADIPIDVGISGVSLGDVAWGDYDNDGDKDLIISGGNYDSYIYRNDNGTFVNWNYDFYGTEDGLGFGSNGFINADIDWADFDNDGDLDFIIMGEGRNQEPDVVRITAFYVNNGPDLNTAGNWLFEQTDEEGNRYPNTRFYQGLNYGTINFADFNNDGLRDFLITGSRGTTINSSDYVTRIYTNNSTSEFDIIPETNNSLRGMGNSAVAVGDFDNDGDLDFVEYGYSGTSGGLGEATRMYRNNIADFVVNDAPQEPFNLHSIIRGDTVLLMWNAPTDDKTDSRGLTYNVRVGSDRGLQDIVSAHALADGHLKIPQMGNAQNAVNENGNFYRLFIGNLPENEIYYWSVQSIDASFKSSVFAAEASFNTNQPSISILRPLTGEVLIGGEFFDLQWRANNVLSVNIEYSADNGVSWEIISENHLVDSDTTTLQWAVPEISSEQALIRVSDAAGIATAAVSSIFRIIPRYVDLIHPIGGESFNTGDTIFIDWTAPYESDWRLEYSVNGGSAWSTITDVLESYGNSSEQWIIPNAPTLQGLVRVYDISRVSVSDISDSFFTIIEVDVYAPVFDDIDFEPVIQLGQSSIISVKVSDATGVGAVNLYHKVAGSADYSTISMVYDGSEEYEATIPGNIQNNKGIQFYVTADDLSGYKAVSDVFAISISINAISNPAPPHAGSTVADYNLFSVPLDLDNKSIINFLNINSDLGSTADNEKYRLYAYQNGSTNGFIQYTGSPGFPDIIPGRAFFIISREDIIMSSGNGKTVDATDEYQISGLASGWNLVGNPFNFAVPFDSIYVFSNVLNLDVDFDLWEWETETGQWNYVETGNIFPWKGYALFIDGSLTNLSLYVPPYPAVDSGLPKFSIANNSGEEWLIRIEAASGSSVNSFIYLGQFNSAEDGKDKYDLNAPPSIASQTYFSFQNKYNKTMVTDIRKSNNEGHIWNFSAQALKHEQKLQLTFTGLDKLNPGINVFLIDRSTLKSYNLKKQKTISFISNDFENRFQLIAGTDEFINKLELNVDLFPAEFDLRQNFPNPFNPETQITFSIPNTANVKLSVYDILGQEIKVLVNQHMEAGHYNFVWNAANYSSGIYFIRLTSAKNIKIIKAMLLK